MDSVNIELNGCQNELQLISVGALIERFLTIYNYQLKAMLLQEVTIILNLICVLITQ